MNEPLQRRGILRGCVQALAMAFLTMAPLHADITHAQDVVYGHLEGVGLVMDVVRPKEGGRGIGVILNASGGFKSNRGIVDDAMIWVGPLVERTGYTLFLVMHGSQPRYTIDEITPQIHHAVRYIRLHAAEYGIRPDRLGIMGISSGGHLALTAGLAGDDGDPAAGDPVERCSSRVQAVLAVCPPTDFMNYGAEGNVDLGTKRLSPFRLAFSHSLEPQPNEDEIGRRISPITHVTPDDAPVLLIHGDKDELVPLQQSQRLEAELKKAGVPTQLWVKPDGGHGWASLPDDLLKGMSWFDKYLAGEEKPEQGSEAAASAGDE